uniref:RhUL146b n=1 Tax=Rhesus cytomegalovirus (strain 68-1) TaxID=47929 RepID=A7LCG0_RHCM6|nr:RhUL146b [macacine betaherpesvirus 3]
MTLIAYHQTEAELRCQCLHVTRGIRPSNIKDITITKPNAGCDRKEIIATLKNGKQVCLDPEAPMMKKLLSKVPEGKYPSFWEQYKEHFLKMFTE